VTGNSTAGWLYLCRVSDSDAAQLGGLLTRLDEVERARAARFVRAEDRLCYAAAHALLRAALDQVRGRHAWRFSADSFGKPVLVDGPADIRFSLTHTDGLVAVAITRGADVGVDAERVGREVSEAAMARIVLATTEIDELDSYADRPARLLTLWVAKEALGKAMGRGLSLPLNGVVLRGESLRVVQVPAGFGPVGRWRLEVERFGEHLVGLASDGACPAERVVVSVEDLAGRAGDGVTDA
jgi:4'-phosphopantetheinyl transferase